MSRADLLQRITADPRIFGGKPIIRRLRISVQTVLNLLAQGRTADELLDDCPELEREDVLACLAYAHAAITHDILDAVRAS